MVWFTLLLILCIVFLIIKYIKINNNFWKKKGVLQINDLMWTFLLDKRSMSEIYKSIYDKYDTPHIGSSMGTTPTLILKNIGDIRAVLAGDFKSFYSRGIHTNPNDILADNLLLMGDYRKWKLVRQRFSYIFTTPSLKRLFYIIEKCARDFVELVEDNRHLRQKPYNVLYTYSTALIGSTVFGVDMESKNSTMYTPFLDMTWKYMKPSLKTNIQVFIAKTFPKIYNLLNVKTFAEEEKFFLSIVKKILGNRKNHIRGNYNFMEMCMDLQKICIMTDFTTGYELYPTDELMAAQAFALFIAGAETTANALHFTLLEIANNRNIMNKLQQEIDGVFGIYREELTYDDIEKLHYLDMVISEALRMYPPIGFIQRKCTKHTVLPSQLDIEKDTLVAIPVFAIHRDEKYYPNPEVFDPERFSRNSGHRIKNFTYLPFGEGNRICIGAKFARLQIKTVLAWLLRRFTVAQQSSTPKFEKTSSALRDPEARYLLIPRDLPVE